MLQQQIAPVKGEHTALSSNAEVSNFLWDLVMKGKVLVFQSAILSRCNHEEDARSAYQEARSLGLQII